MPTEILDPALPVEGWLEAQPVRIQYQPGNLEGVMTSPAEATGIVIFVHSRIATRRARHNRYLTEFLARRKFVVLEVGLLSQEEETAGTDLAACFENHPTQLAGRLVACAQWVRRQRTLQPLPLGCLGFGLGGTSVLMAAAALTAAIDALVVADALPDLVGNRLANILTPTLLVVSDTSDIERRMNEIACARLRCEKRLEVVPGAITLINGDARDRVVALASAWFQRHLRPRTDLAPDPVMN